MSKNTAVQRALDTQALNAAHNADRQGSDEEDSPNRSQDDENDDAFDPNMDQDQDQDEDQEHNNEFNDDEENNDEPGRLDPSPNFANRGNSEQGDEDDNDPLNHGQVAEQEEIPTDKDGLIEYLMRKLAGTEETINDAFESFQQEKELTRLLNLEFETKRRDLMKLQQVENRPFKEKVHEKIEKTLEKAVEEKVKAENARNEMKVVLNEREMMVDELDLNQRILHTENEIRGRQLKELEDRVFEHDNMIESLDNKKNELETEASEKDDDIKRLLRERDDMRGVMQKLNDVKNVLNRLLTNPELLYAREDKLIDLDRPREPVRNNLEGQGRGPNSPGAQNQLNKPGYMVNEDDFWYADPVKDTYAKDYGGRDKNYNEKYNFNTKVAQGQLQGQGSQQSIQRPMSNESGQNASNYSGSPTNSLPPINNKSQSRNNIKSNSSARNKVNVKKKAY